MLTNTNVMHNVADDSEITSSIIVIVQFSAFDLDHTLTVQPSVFKDVSKYTKELWRKTALKTSEITNHSYSFPYTPVVDSVPNFDDLQTMWFVYEQLRLKLLEENPTWDGAKLVNNVPKGVLQ